MALGMSIDVQFISLAMQWHALHDLVSEIDATCCINSFCM